MTHQVVLPRSRVRILVAPVEQRWLLVDDDESGRSSLETMSAGQLTPLDPLAAPGALVSWQFVSRHVLFRIGNDAVPATPSVLTMIGRVADDGTAPSMEVDGETRRVEVVGGQIWYAEWHGRPGVAIVAQGADRTRRIDLRRRLHHLPGPTPDRPVRWGARAVE